MQVVETFVSINGESTRAGELAVFIRFKGCNLCCSYCDTAWANEKDCKYEEKTVMELVDYVKSTGVNNVTLTGGEPLLQSEVGVLIEELIRSGKRVEIETNGSVDIGKFCNDNRPVFTMDYKLPGSGCEGYMNADNFAKLQADDTVKFVSGSITDLDKAREIIEKYNLIGRCNLYISPVFGKIESEEIVNYMIKNNMNGVRLQIQMHKVIWDPDKRGV